MSGEGLGLLIAAFSRADEIRIIGRPSPISPEIVVTRRFSVARKTHTVGDTNMHLTIGLNGLS